MKCHWVRCCFEVEGFDNKMPDTKVRSLEKLRESLTDKLGESKRVVDDGMENSSLCL